MKAIAAGSWHTLVVKTDGSVWGVGENSNGQLGDGTRESRSTFVEVIGIGTWDIGLEKVVGVGAGVAGTVGSSSPPPNSARTAPAIAAQTPAPNPPSSAAAKQVPHHHYLQKKCYCQRTDRDQQNY